ncbi:hypothetical protein H6G80_17385 [Nostoc sp. FACHB-87]|uniref:hypothetical protein n=1 Tax=Nostocaceae TaxID=1162 RepID=UPI001684AE3C|nr:MULTISPECIES: hypothetical protein [Nostocaceae]MBD2455848.1 hypothetical protein [Nostoc sp. FACHB-87]MBD2478434.1 hypothetical protein [Anabaena sp. FACHB-83]
MTNSGDRETYNSETKQQSYTDNYGNTHTNVTRTSESVNNNVSSYSNGYANGREIERNYQQANLAARDNENASRGLLLGILLTSLAGLIVGAFWYFNQPRETVINETQPVVTPSPNSGLPSPQPQQTTIIERTREVPIVVPQQQVPPVNIPAQSDINITVPSQQPSNSETQTTPRQDSTNNSADGSQTNTSKTVIPQSSDQPNGSSNTNSSTTDNIGSDKNQSR